MREPPPRFCSFPPALPRRLVNLICVTSLHVHAQTTWLWEPCLVTHWGVSLAFHCASTPLSSLLPPSPVPSAGLKQPAEKNEDIPF